MDRFTRERFDKIEEALQRAADRSALLLERVEKLETQMVLLIDGRALPAKPKKAAGQSNVS